MRPKIPESFKPLAPRSERELDPNTPVRVFTRGEQARRLMDSNGIRYFFPFRVSLDVQLSPLSITSTTLVFYLYQESYQGAMERTKYMLRQFYQLDRQPFDGYPKPVHGGTCTRMDSDDEFVSIYRQAKAEGKNVLAAGNQEDPVAFTVKDPSLIIVHA